MYLFAHRFKNGTDNFAQIPAFCMVFGMMWGTKEEKLLINNKTSIISNIYEFPWKQLLVLRKGGGVVLNKWTNR